MDSATFDKGTCFANGRVSSLKSSSSSSPKKTSYTVKSLRESLGQQNVPSMTTRNCKEDGSGCMIGKFGLAYTDTKPRQYGCVHGGTNTEETKQVCDEPINGNTNCNYTKTPIPLKALNDYIKTTQPMETDRKGDSETDKYAQLATNLIGTVKYKHQKDTRKIGGALSAPCGLLRIGEKPPKFTCEKGGTDNDDTQQICKEPINGNRNCNYTDVDVPLKQFNDYLQKQ